MGDEDQDDDRRRATRTRTSDDDVAQTCYPGARRVMNSPQLRTSDVLPNTPLRGTRIAVLQPMSTRSRLGAAVLTLLQACAGNQVQDADSNEANYAAALVAVAAGATLWAVGGGCNLQQCPYGSHCNKKTGFCDVTKCTDGCPDGTTCNEGLNRCQVPPPPFVAHDFLPLDEIGRPLLLR